jgi:SWI/SNF-related matrix-associated actin-dependent regulator 1 of chromatin subfamily A
MPADLVALSRALTPSAAYQPPGAFTRLFPYQQAALEQAPLREHLLLAHAPGLGKTPMALAMLADDAVVICPPTIARQWAAKMLEWTGVTPELLVTGKAVADVARYRRGPVIVSDSLLHLIPSSVETTRLIIDEVHRFKSLDTRRSVYLFGGTYRSTKVVGLATRSERVIALTGTPLQSSPIDLYPLLRRCAPAIAPSFSAFTNRYCPVTEMRVPGAPWPIKRYDLKVQNLDEFAFKLRSTVMIRPPTAECQAQLPPLLEDSFWLSVDDPAEGIDDEQVIAVLAGDGVASEQSKTAMATLRRETGLAKARADVLLAWLRDLMEGGERPILWCWHQDVANYLGDYFHMPVIHGGVPMEVRHLAISAYQQGVGPGLVLTIGAASTGLDGLQHSGTLCVFVEQSVNPNDNEQAVARLHRTGQTRGVRVVRVRTRTVIDRSIEAILRRKIGVITETLR